ncbi:MAG: type II secretion system protein, partial [Bdellovibrionales bacterium]|nr:type II secretion system protein [Bdellovibrionales bacterium]
MRNREGGSSLVESMVAFVIIGSVAVAVFPIFSDVQTYQKLGDVKAQCEQAVKAKLNGYLLGRPVDVAALDARLQNMSLSSFSLTSIDAGAGTRRAGGFMYAKMRYNRYFPYVCNGDLTVDSDNILFTGYDLTATGGPNFPGAPADQRQLGMRECLGNEIAWYDGVNPIVSPDAGAGPAACNTVIDDRVGRALPGFKVYVKLQLKTPWASMGPYHMNGGPE